MQPVLDEEEPLLPILIPRSAIPSPIETPVLEDIDVFVPILVITGQPATQAHFSKLTRFVQSLRAAGKSVPFLLRNISVEPEL